MLLGTLAFFLLFMKGLISPERDRKFLVAAMFFLPVAGLFLANFAAPAPMAAKRLVFLPIYLVCVSAGIISIRERKARAVALTAVIAFSILPRKSRTGAQQQLHRT